MQTLLTLAQASEILAISTKTLRAHISAGELAYINIGHGDKRKDIRIDPDDLRAFIDRRKRIDFKPPPRATRRSIAPKSSDTTEIIGFTARCELMRAEKAAAKTAKTKS